MPRVRVRVPRGLDAADRADRLLGRHRAPVPHARRQLHRVGLVGAEAAVGPRPALRGPQGRAVLPARRHGAVQPRGGAGLQGRRGPVGVRDVPRHAARGRAARGRPHPGLDDDAVDAALARRARGLARPRLRPHHGRLRAGRGARGLRARRGRAGRRPLPRPRHAGRALRAAVPVHRHRGVRPQGPHGPAGRLRQRRGRHGRRPQLDRVRRGRLPARPGAGHHGHQPGPRRRHVRRPDGPVRRPLGQGGRPGHRRRPARARPPAARGEAAARLPALLALRDAAALLRQAVVVHPHVAAARPPARRQRDRLLAPGAHQARPLRQVAGEQRRLGDLARALLGHAAAGLALRERPRGVHRRVRGPRGEGRPRDRRPASPLRRRAHVGLPGVRRRDAPRARGHRRLVRLGRDAVRPVPRAVREPGPLRGPLPRRLHLRGDRPDARLVLLADRGLDAAVRPLALPDRAVPRPHRRRRGQEDVEVARQHRPAVGGARAPRRRRVPLVLPHLQAAVGRLPVLHRRGRRVAAPVPAPAVEHVRLLRPVRQRQPHRRGRRLDGRRRPISTSGSTRG